MFGKSMFLLIFGKRSIEFESAKLERTFLVKQNDM